MQVKDTAFLRLDELLEQYVRHPNILFSPRLHPLYQNFSFQYLGESHNTALSHGAVLRI